MKAYATKLEFVVIETNVVLSGGLVAYVTRYSNIPSNPCYMSLVLYINSIQPFSSSLLLLGDSECLLTTLIILAIYRYGLS